MRRSLLLTALVLAVPAVSSLALADDPAAVPSSSASGSASTTAPTATAPAPSASAPPPSSTVVVVEPLAPPPPPQTPSSFAVTEDDPLRLLQLIRGEADRQKMARIGGALTAIVAGAGAATSGVLLLSVADDTYGRVFGWFTIGIGIGTGLSSIFSFFGSGSLERLADAYAPIAEDTSIPATVRRARGEDTLRAVAGQEKSGRMINGITSIILGAAVGALGVGIALSLDITDNFRVPLAVVMGFGGVSIVANGIGQIVWVRGPAEVAIEHWDAARGAPHAASLQLRPMLVPLQGGGMAGVSFSY
ncbi:hypothetical protein BH09MYX1_BH09MYX1_35240 [soil metagenome]